MSYSTAEASGRAKLRHLLNNKTVSIYYQRIWHVVAWNISRSAGDYLCSERPSVYLQNTKCSKYLIICSIEKLFTVFISRVSAVQIRSLLHNNRTRFKRVLLLYGVRCGTALCSLRVISARGRKRRARWSPLRLRLWQASRMPNPRIPQKTGILAIHFCQNLSIEVHYWWI